MANLWVHDYNDEFGIHYGIDTSNYIDPATGKNYADDHGTAMLTKESLDKLTNKDTLNPYLYPYPGTTNRGETFTEAKNRYYTSSFVTQGGDGDHQHPIIAVFDGSRYIWPSRSPKDATGNMLYIFKDYASNEKQEIVSNNSRTKSISKAGGEFSLYIDTYNIEKLYKCNYSFAVISSINDWVYVENGTPAKESQNIINNKDTTTINREYNANFGSVWWDYSINETNNTLIGIAMHEKDATEVDSTLHITIKQNLSPFKRTAIVKLYDQFDQYRGMLIGETNGNGSSVITYTIEQEADNIEFNKIEFYNNDNTSATVKTDCYGPMPGRGGDGWIYFKISGSSEQGAIRTFGEYPNQTIDNLQWLCNINDCSMYNPTFNPGTGIWTMKVKFNPNTSGASTEYSGDFTVTVDKNEVSYNGKETVQITPGGISSSGGSTTSGRTFTFTIKEMSSTVEPAYTGNVSGSICYTQNGATETAAAQPTFSYEIVDKSITWANVSQTGVVSFDQNNTGSSRTVEIKVYCNEQPSFSKTIKITQLATDTNFSSSDAYIKFYTDESAITETTYYGPISGEVESNKNLIFFKVFGKNDNNVYSELTDISKITSITSDTCTCLFDTLIFISTNNIFKCNISIPANNGAANTTTGELSLSCPDAEYKDGSLGLITVNGLTIDNSNSNTIATAKEHIIKVKVESKDITGNTCTYKQNAGNPSSEYITDLAYELSLSGTKVTGSDVWVYTNESTKNIYISGSNSYVKWKENTSSEIRGGKANEIQLTCNCYRVLNGVKETNIYKSISISPRQKYNSAIDIPKEYEITSITWTTLYLFDSNDYNKTTEAIKITPTGTNYKSIKGISANGGTTRIYFKIYGTATYSNGTDSYTENLFYGSSSSISNPSSKITCNVVNNTYNSVSISSGTIYGIENFYVDITVGSTTNTSSATIANIYFSLASDTSGNNYWSATKFNNSNKAITLTQNGYIVTPIIPEKLYDTITFYNTISCTTSITSLDVSSSANTYTVYFKVTNSSTGEIYTGSASEILLCERTADMYSSTVISASSTNSLGVYFINRSIDSVSYYQKVYIIDGCSCGSDSLSGSVEIWKNAPVEVITCTLNFYSPTSSETSYDSWVYTNVFNNSTGTISSTSITSSSGYFTDTTSKYICLKASEKPTVYRGQSSVTVTNVSGDIYRFSISSNTSTSSSVTYSVSIGCSTSKTLKLVLPARSVTVTYKIVWNNIFWDTDLNESSTSGFPGTRKMGCYNDETFLYRFRVAGTQTTYENGVAKTDSGITVYLDNINYISSSLDSHSGQTHLLSSTVSNVSGMTSVFYIKGYNNGVIPNNIKTTDTSNRSCKITISVKAKTTGSTTWSAATNLSSFTITQFGNTWDPYFTY